MVRLTCRGIGCLLFIALFVPAGFSRALAEKVSSEPNQPGESVSATGVPISSSDTPDAAKSSESTVNTAPPAPAEVAADGKQFATDDLPPAPRFTPMLAATGTIGLFALETGDTLAKGGFVFSGFGNKFGRMPGSVTILETGLNFSYGVTDTLNIYAGFNPYGHVHVGCPGQLSLRSIPLSTCVPGNLGTPVPGSFFPYEAGTAPGYVADYPFASGNTGGIGNITLGVKYAFLSERKGARVSFSVRNDLGVSSRTDVTKLLNNGTQGSPLSDLVSLAVSKKWGNHFTATLNFGYMFVRAPRDSQDAVLLAMPDQLRVGAGIVSFPESRVQLIWEYSGVVFVSAPGTPADNSFGAREPIEGVYGLRIYPSKHVGIDLGYVRMLNLRDLNDRNGFVVKIGAGYSPAKAAPVNHPPTISCTADKNTVTSDPGEIVTVTCNGSDPDNDPLTYTWSSTGGKVDGVGPAVRWRSQGVTPGTYTVTAKVDDGRGGYASASVTVRVEPRP